MFNDHDMNSVKTFDIFYMKIEILTPGNYKTG